MRFKIVSTKRNQMQLCLLGVALLHAAVGAAQTTVTRISAGFSYSLFIKSDGSLWGWVTTSSASWATALTLTACTKKLG